MLFGYFMIFIGQGYVMEQHLEITFDNCAPADAARLVQDLQSDVRETEPSVSSSLKKERPDSQDFGTTLVLVLGTPVAIALARAVTAFIQRNNATITIKRNGEVVASNLKSADAARIAEAFSGKK